MKKRKKAKSFRPAKRTTEELFKAINRAVKNGEYYFTDHGEKRSRSRKRVNDLEVIKILGGRDMFHEASKDKYIRNNEDWNYHIRGNNTDGDDIRIVISFDQEGMPIITVINLNENENE